ncbi:hypothetical protein PAXRUDRAFT_13187 [Paxillus rubicundulus Ve08.2h10]|uniref:Uncharacterized protein n=1 Tax=Paxillus rubicundulus Ve08.2h10 TaxID=930991 RepID=A0A0D0DZH6_9AGAM|nr:hypothetical protein PAXRUDRAFT_13187 [Paxillus rubicundulus Ve08.2h10]
MVFKTAPSFLSMIGSAIIIGSMVYVIPKTTFGVFLDLEDGALEEGLLNRSLDSQEFVKLEDMASTRSPPARTFDQGRKCLSYDTRSAGLCEA